MSEKLKVSSRIFNIVKKLQDSGFTAYIVGGAIRDLMLDREPKDYDISTSATPEQVRAVFGRRNARIIGVELQGTVNQILVRFLLQQKYPHPVQVPRSPYRPKVHAGKV